VTPELLDLLAGGEREAGRVYGVVSATVTDNHDPEKIGRVRVRFPWLGDGTETWWARVSAPAAGGQRGVWLLPEVGDEVLVAFEHGDPRFPYVLGGLWNKNDLPPEDIDADGADHRSLTSRSGHVVRLDDKDGEEKIEIIDKTGKNKLVITSKDNGLEISVEGDVKIASGSGKVLIEGADVEIKATNSAKVQAGTALDLKCDAQATLKGATVAIN
jgi:uncharacterized protein involved in type VI secretion and phage assembly